MSLQTLEKAFTTSDKAFKITNGTINPSFDSFLAKYYWRQGKEINIAALDSTVDISNRSSTIYGTSTYLNVPNLPVTARFYWDNKGQVRSTLTYTLIDETKTSQYWKFSDSFPQLPLHDTITDNKGEDVPFLDTLLFRHAEVIVTNESFIHPDYGVEITEGIHFVGKLRPSGALGIVSNLLDSKDEVIVHGNFHLPPDDTTVYVPELAVDQTKGQVYPWEIATQLPGIHLKADINWNFKLGSAKFQNPALQIYCPLDKDWILTSLYYEPVIGFTGNLEISKGDLSIDMIARVPSGANSLYFEARMDGFSLENIAKLSGVTGKNSLFSEFPQELQKALKGASKLELMDLGFGIGLSKKGINVSTLTFQIGVPNVNWKIWKEHLVLTGLGSRFTIQDPFNKPQVDVRVWGSTKIEGVPVTLLTSKGTGWVFMATLDESQTLPLDKLIKSFAPTVETPSKLTIDDMLLALAPGKGIRFTGALAQSPGWTLQLGQEKLTLQDITFDLAVGANGSLDGQFAGKLSLGGVDLDFKYAVPGEFVIRSVCDEITFQGLAKRFTGKKTLVPSGFNPKVKEASLLIKNDKTGLVLQVGGTVDKSTCVFEAKKTSSGWGFATGIRLSNPKLSKLPGLKDLAALENIVSLQDLTLVLGTYESKDFRFPNLGAFNNPALTSQNMPMPAQSGGLQAGFNAYGTWKLDTSKKETKLLRKLLGLDPKVDITLQVSPQPAKSSRVFLSYQGKVNKNWPLSCQVGVGLNQGTPEFFLMGQLQAKIQKQPCIFDIAMSMVKTGMYLGGTMKGTVKVEGLQISNLSLMFGMNWGGIPSLGVAGMISSKKFTGSVAVLFDANDPSKSLVAGSVSDLSLLDIVEEIAKVKKAPEDIKNVLEKIGFVGTKPFYLPNSSADSLDEKDLTKVATDFSKKGGVKLSTSSDQVLLVTKDKGKSWHLTDMPNNMMHYQLTKTPKGIKVTLDTQLYVAPQASQIGTLQFDQGFFLNGTLKILGLEWTSTVNVNPRKGVSVDTYTNKALTIYKPQFFKLSDIENKKGPRLSLATFNQPKHEIKEFRKPHLYLNGKLSLLGIEVAESFVQINKNGFQFYLEQNRGINISCNSLSAKVMAGFSINGSFNSINNFTAGGGAEVTIQGKVNLGKLLSFTKKIPGASLNQLGSIKINLQAKGKVQTGYQKNKAFARFEGSFAFQKTSYKIKKDLNANDKALAKIGDSVFDEVKNVFTDLFGTAEKWIEGIKNGLVEGIKDVEEMGKVLKDVFKKPAKEAAKLLLNAGKSMDDVGKALKGAYKQSAKDVAKTFKGLGKTSTQVAGVLKKTFNLSASQTAKALSDAGDSVEQIGGALKGVYRTSGKEAAKIFKGLGKGSSEVAKTLKNTFKMSAKDVSGTMKDVFKLSKKDMEKVLKGAGFAAKEVSKSIGKAFKKVGKVFKL